MLRAKGLPLAVALTVGALWLAWALAAVFALPPAHDEIITLLNMRNNAVPDWEAFASVAQHQTMFEGPLASFGDIAPMLKATDVHPTLYYHVALLASKLGADGLVPLRLVSLALTVLAAGLVAALAARFAKGEAPWALPLVVVALASASTVAYAGINARSYALVFLEAACLAWCLALFCDPATRSKGWSALGLGVASAALVWTHYFGVLAVGAALMAALAFGVRDRRAASWWGLAAVVAGVAIGALLPWVAVHVGARENQYAGFSGWPFEAMAIIKILIEQFSFTTKAPWTRFAFLAIAPLALLLFFRVFWAKNLAHPAAVRAFASAVVVGLVLILCLFWWTDKTLRTADSSRYGLFVIAFLLPVFAASARGNVLGLALVVALGATSWWGRARMIQPWEWETAFASTVEALDGSTAVVLNHGQRGVAGSVVYRAQAGWIGFAYHDPVASGVVLPPEVERVLLHGFGTPIADPLFWSDWEAFLASNGFSPRAKGVWER